jgi:hypothetical protein
MSLERRARRNEYTIAFMWNEDTMCDVMVHLNDDPQSVAMLSLTCKDNYAMCKTYGARHCIYNTADWSRPSLNKMLFAIRNRALHIVHPPVSTIPLTLILLEYENRNAVIEVSKQNEIWYWLVDKYKYRYPCSSCISSFLHAESEMVSAAASNTSTVLGLLDTVLCVAGFGRYARV